MKKTLKKYKIERNTPCPCGSGKKHKICCQDLIEKRQRETKTARDYFEKAETLYKKKLYQESEQMFRAHLTQYIIWYHEHTVPFKKHSPEAAKDLLFTDIEAIYAIADSVAKTLFLQNKINDIPLFYSRLENVVDDFIYNFFIHCQCAYWFDYIENEKEANNIISRYIDINLDSIPLTHIGKRALEIYLQLTYLTSPAIKSYRIIDKMISSENTVDTKLHLLTQRTRIAFLHNDKILVKKSAKEIIKEISGISDTELNTSKSLMFILPDTYRMLAIALDDTEYYVNLVTICKNNISQNLDDKTFIAVQNYLISQAYTSLNTLDKAKEYLLKALESAKKKEYLLDLVKIHIKLNETKLAIKLLEDLNYDSLSEDLKVDYLSYYVDIALTSKNKHLAIQTEKKLAVLNITLPFLQMLTNGFRSLLLDFLSEKYTNETLLTRLKNFSVKNLILQPNLFGVGINFNEILKPKENKNI